MGKEMKMEGETKKIHFVSFLLVICVFFTNFALENKNCVKEYGK